MGWLYIAETLSSTMHDKISKSSKAWCRQATSHYLSQFWPRFMSPYGVTRPQWIKNLAEIRKCSSQSHYNDEFNGMRKEYIGRENWESICKTRQLVTEARHRAVKSCIKCGNEVNGPYDMIAECKTLHEDSTIDGINDVEMKLKEKETAQ